MKTYEGRFCEPGDARFAIVSARFNEFVVDRLVEGALSTLRRAGVPEDHMVHVRVPGAFEMPVACRRLARNGEFSAILALGTVIRGATAHFDYVAGEAARGCGAVAAETGVPVIFGVLTTDTIEQAIERAGTKAGNKGGEAALTALEMVSLGGLLMADGL